MAVRLDATLADMHPEPQVANVTADTAALPATPLSSSPPSIAHAVVAPDVAGDATFVALSDALAFTLTVGQALEKIISAGRRPPSERSIQRYCIDGKLAAQKIRTTYGSEWLINEASLHRLIEGEPVVASVAGDAKSTAPATPTVSNVALLPAANDVAGDDSAADAEDVAAPVGERRTLADVLIENARLVAQVEGKGAIIDELKEDRNFLREEVREARKTRDDVKNISERMLDTLKTMVIGRLAASSPTSSEPIRGEFVDPSRHQV